jgi:hypothetical protein
MKQSLIILLFVGLFFVAHPSISKTTSATTSGNWTAGGTWDNGVPASGDLITINPGITVTVNSSIDLTGAAATTINILGTLSFDDPPGLFNVATIQLNNGDGDGINVSLGGLINALDLLGGGIVFGPPGISLITISPILGDDPIDGPAVISDGVLPVTLLSFNAEVRDDVVKLKWVTATEVNNDYFTIERASNIEQFEVVGDAIPGSGTSKEMKAYTAFDITPLYGRSYYRLKKTDYDGKFTYSEVVVVDYEGPRRRGVWDSSLSGTLPVRASLRLCPRPKRSARASASSP